MRAIYVRHMIIVLRDGFGPQPLSLTRDLQHYYDEHCSPKSWSSLLTSPLAENNGGPGAKKYKNAWYKSRETRRMFSGVLSCTDTKTQS